jgi:hypothetical protein
MIGVVMFTPPSRFQPIGEEIRLRKAAAHNLKI